jgi:negative regulator of flagellin synthesis FlgM
MAINTNGVSPSLTRSAPQGQTSRANPASGSPAAEKHGERADADKVSLTGAAETLRKLETAIASIPDVNADRVERLKNAVARGEYAMDSNRIAEKMIALERMLGAKI